ncbi:periplasmic chaperone for outer membrane proteins Skp [Arcticibacter tournemirensis]|uniref:OmpH family outer membrane protein n=1 Tax=Arcticibacter tournemirensis TaxID=699437 RepID=A0A5M9HB34_9SPHI|nr:OmpH family outer membrane protein [Arcticibacter tournemirensis]KAA8482197.1 OmpH family outer membrane protein [Arcticibacter tournemirensis]TQM52335.1 periplasmic chaperone for outer membrane proteins Skp [Arcticibacter tournemirensis]
MNISFKSMSKLAAGLLMAAVVVSCNNNKEKANDSTPAAAAAEAKADKIVFVNSDSLVNNYDYFKEIKSKLEVKSKNAQQDLSSKGNAFQREVAEYQQKAKDMSADERASTEQRLARKQQELAAFNQNASSALANESAAENEKLYDKVAEYLKTYAKQKGYKMVLTYSKSNPSLLFADESLDVTQDVVKGLNEAYKKDKK